ncbi:MAG: hypothetical protein KJ655_04665, partial [Candidatus Thermoplasmatota archaeon]|nr:hypothetical protein [Candidatus Thermoplasmatota archaeon]
MKTSKNFDWKRNLIFRKYSFTVSLILLFVFESPVIASIFIGKFSLSSTIKVNALYIFIGIIAPLIAGKIFHFDPERYYFDDEGIYFQYSKKSPATWSSIESIKSVRWTDLGKVV